MILIKIERPEISRWQFMKHFEKELYIKTVLSEGALEWFDLDQYDSDQINDILTEEDCYLTGWEDD